MDVGSGTEDLFVTAADHQGGDLWVLESKAANDVRQFDINFRSYPCWSGNCGSTFMWIRITEACLETSQCRYRAGSTWKEIVSICGPLPRDLIGVIWILSRRASASPEISIILPYRAGWGNQSGITED